MILGRFGCALSAGVVIIGNLAWDAFCIGDILGGARELGVSLFFVTAC